jgi:hypothetical protein
VTCSMCSKPWQSLLFKACGNCRTKAANRRSAQRVALCILPLRVLRLLFLPFPFLDLFLLFPFRLRQVLLLLGLELHPMFLPYRTGVASTASISNAAGFSVGDTGGVGNRWFLVQPR